MSRAAMLQRIADLEAQLRKPRRTPAKKARKPATLPPGKFWFRFQF